MNCQVVSELLSPYLDGALDPDEHALVQKHLVSCSTCSHELAELEACMNLLQELPELTPPAGFRAGLMEKIDRLPLAEPAKQKRWTDHVNAVTRKSWYRTMAVAAVMAMTLGLTTLWENEGNQFMPVPSDNQGIVGQIQNKQDVQQPQGGQPTKPANDKVDKVSNETDPPVKVEGDTSNRTQGVKEPPKQAVTVNPVKVVESEKDRKFASENYQPQQSAGMTARSVALKLTAEDSSAVLKSIHSITQSNNSSIIVPYNESNGKLAIKVPAQASTQVEKQLKSLGQVITDMPSERDLSNQHQQAVSALEQLQTEQASLQQQVEEQADAEAEQQLAMINTAISQQIKLIQNLEQQSNYSIITIAIE
ncbi:zf-HC2 domain-containing protein [Desulfotomaculum sp. 1211_IL3151]|uniref:zf-HC2 domain-containing protein n=1 Tax=Desulfotomaculum sp. 1211_IL3151 TaxID=3084055 RepID=UPI002FD87D0E